jgi:hypothetical protein
LSVPLVLYYHHLDLCYDLLVDVLKYSFATPLRFKDTLRFSYPNHLMRRFTFSLHAFVTSDCGQVIVAWHSQARLDDIGADALVTQEDFQAVVEEGEEVRTNLTQNTQRVRLCQRRIESRLDSIPS